MRRILISTIAACALLSGCDALPGTIQGEAKAAMRKVAFDPGAVKMSFVSSSDQAACGTVNGKNRFGAYVGSKPFIYMRPTGWLLTYEGDPTADEARNLADAQSTTDPLWNDTYDELSAKCRFIKLWPLYCKGPNPTADPEQICPKLDSKDGFKTLLEKYRSRY